LLSQVLVGRGRSERGQGDLQAAEATFRDAVDVAPDDEHALFHLAATLLDAGRPAEALPLLQRVRNRRWRYPRVHEALAQTQMMLGNGQEALAALQTAADLQPRNAGVLLRLAVALTQASRLDSAVLYYERALAIDPNLAAAWFNLALVQGARGNRSESLDAAQRASNLARQRGDAELLEKTRAFLHRLESHTP
jgi:tetratricopeptide (TPR) repeat protein